MLLGKGTNIDNSPWNDNDEEDRIADDPPFDMRGHNMEPVKHQVTLMKDTLLEYPQLYLEVFVASDDPGEQSAFASLFVRCGCTKAETIEKADLVVFVGGEDVEPALYGEKAHPSTYFNQERDSQEMDLFLKCKEMGIPMFGVCRGAQFLHVMHGGKLYQDVDNHNGDHIMWDSELKKSIERVSSVHHQMVRYNVDGGQTIIATSNKSRKRWIDDDIFEIGTKMEVEAFFYRDTCTFGVQGHPEYSGYHAFAIWTMEKLKAFVNENPDIDLIEGQRRIKPELLAERQWFTLEEGNAS